MNGQADFTFSVQAKFLPSQFVSDRNPTQIDLSQKEGGRLMETDT